VDAARDLSVLHVQLTPFPQSAIPIQMTTNAAFHPLAKPCPGAHLVLGIKLDPSSFGRILVNMRVYGVIPFFGSISQERDDKGDFCRFPLQRNHGSSPA